MSKDKKSIYQLTREELGYSRQQAADKIAEVDGGRYSYIDENRLVKLEHGTAKILPEDVVALSKAYNKPELRNHFCCHGCEIGSLDAPEVSFDDGIHEILVSMAVSLKTVNHNKIRLMEILEDGVLSEDEKEDFDRIYEELERVSMTVEALQLWCEKMKLRINEK